MCFSVNWHALGLACNRYYAHALLTCLHRSLAVSEWARIRRGEPVSLERALGAFDLFIPESGYGDLEEVSRCTLEISFLGRLM